MVITGKILVMHNDIDVVFGLANNLQKRDLTNSFPMF